MRIHYLKVFKHKISLYTYRGQTFVEVLSFSIGGNFR